MTRPIIRHIYPDNIRHNFNIAKQLCPKAKVVSMVKANAYGHGIELVGRALSSHTDYFGVACLSEARALRKIGISTPILLVEGVFNPEFYHEASRDNYAVVIQSNLQLEQLLQQTLAKPIEVWLKVNTGMNRLGFSIEDAEAVYYALQSYLGISQVILMSHLACADTPQHMMNAQQRARFYSLKQHLNIPSSLSNSGAIASGYAKACDYIRPGLMLYGSSPIPTVQTAEALQLKPAQALYSKIIALHDLSPGDTVGYGATYKAKKTMKLATIAAGYGDGYPRHIDTSAFVMLQGRKAPVVGIVSMDMLTIDVTDFADISLGATVELWGTLLSIDEFAQHANTISYDVMCRMPLRAHAKIVRT